MTDPVIPGDGGRVDISTGKTVGFHEAVIRTASEGICVCFSIAEFPFVRFTVWNSRMTEITGYTLEEINRLGWYQTVYTDSETRERAIMRMERMRDGHDMYAEEWEITRKDREQRTLAISTSVVEIDGGIQAVVGMMQDVTERKRAEEALRVSQQLLQSITVSSPHWIYIFDLDSLTTTYSNRPVLGELGYSPEVSREKSRLEAFRDFMPTGVTPHLERVLEEWRWLAPGQQREDEYCLLNADGTTHWFAGHEIVFTRRDDGSARQILGSFTDITPQKRAEKSLRDSEQRYRLIAELASSFCYQATIAANHQISYQWVNGKFAEVTGYQPEELSGMGWFNLIPADDLPAILAKVSAFRSPETRHGEALEARILTRSGELRWVSSVIEVVPPQGADEPLTIYGAVLDITARKRAEEALRESETRIRHAQKLESLGVLAGGIAHDFNNLLTSMLGYASLALMQLPSESPACPMLREIEQAAERAADLTQQMLAYSGKGRFVIQTIRLDILIREMSKLLQTVISKNAKIELNLDPATTEGDATQVRQVVMNLMINASDSLQGAEGIIRVRTGTRNANASDLRSPYLSDELPPGPYAFVEIEDTGCGMNTEVMARIFDPFFSTKFTGRGLGLAAVLGIVRSHRGTIKVTSTLGVGTVFQVLIPHAGQTPKSAAEAPRTTGLPQGQGTILVVDDEPTVRTFAQHVLESAGFTVRTAGDGREGLDVFVQAAHELVAVLLDLTMPRMNGLEALREIRRLAPEIPVLVMSGYSEEQVLSRALELGATGFVQKPFNPRQLVERMCQLTGSGS